MPGNGEIFLDQVRRIQSADMGVLATSKYFDAQMPTAEANCIEWDEFRVRIRPFGAVALPSTNLDCLFVPKTVPWGTEDVTVFVGEDDRRINEIDDLTDHEGKEFFGFNFGIARGLVDKTDRQSIQVSIGFNAQDLSIGHHTVLRLHSHIRSLNGIDAARRQRLSWREMDRFSQLSFIEPFAPLYHDYITNAIEEGALAGFLTGAPSAYPGYTSMVLERRDELENIFPDIKSLYQGMKSEYEVIADIFSDGTIDQDTQRPLPRPRAERELLLDQFLKSRDGFYSDESVRTLKYLVEHIQKAVPRGQLTDISSAAMAYITRGFAGGMTFAFTADDMVRFDFMPRVITTSAVTKTMLGQGLPTRIDKSGSAASDEEKEIAERYYKDILGFIN